MNDDEKKQHRERSFSAHNIDSIFEFVLPDVTGIFKEPDLQSGFTAGVPTQAKSLKFSLRKKAPERQESASFSTLMNDPVEFPDSPAYRVSLAV
ncbi:MAG: hypothetical protein N3G75_02525 [Methanothrix sp.]|nr:hypothetical protein [Methanothrix sp.]MCX8206691.1 hypothetical protein [Methanothrix sp.]